jgi:hypothetical protein
MKVLVFDNGVGFDLLAYTCFGNALGYGMRNSPFLWFWTVGWINIPFFSMELKHYICEELVMQVGEAGPVESIPFFLIISGDNNDVDIRGNRDLWNQGLRLFDWVSPWN